MKLNDRKAYSGDTKTIATIRDFSSNLKLQDDMENIFPYHRQDSSTLLNSEKSRVGHIEITNT